MSTEDEHQRYHLCASSSQDIQKKSQNVERLTLPFNRLQLGLDWGFQI